MMAYVATLAVVGLFLSLYGIYALYRCARSWFAGEPKVEIVFWLAVHCACLVNADGIRYHADKYIGSSPHRSTPNGHR